MIHRAFIRPINTLRQSGRRGVALAAALIVVVSAPLAFPAIAAADVENFTITDFAADYYVSDRDPQGQMVVEEHIDVNFSDQNHGLLRAIPETFNKTPVQLHINKVTSPSGAPAKYSTEHSNGNTVLKIGDANKTVTGQQQYVINYTLRNVLGFYVGQSELYWNVNGVGWSQRFDHVAATVHLEGGLTVNAQAHQPACYSGAQGTKGQDCLTTYDASNPRLFKVETTEPLQPNTNLSFALALSSKNVHPTTWRDQASDYWRPAAAILLPPLVMFAYAFRLWRRRGRDDTTNKAIIPMYDAPDSLGPLEVGAISDFNPNNRDITATIIGLAINKYVRIHETRSERLIGKDKLSYELELLKTDFSGLKNDERVLLGALFAKPELGAKIAIASASSSLAATAKQLGESVRSRLTTAGYFKADPLKAGAGLYAFAGGLVFVAIFLANVLHGVAVIGVGLAAIVAFIFARIMPARTAKGAEALWHIRGLKMYLQTAEADRMAKLQSPNAPYAADHGQPARTVELFEKLLPYAIVLGVEKDWAKQFEGLYATPPDWYGGSLANATAFNVGYLAGSLGDGFQGAVNTSFSPPSSSGSSGFGGGGFSGGGGGGGGGGGW